MEYGLITVAAAIPQVRVADPEFNLRAIEELVARADGIGVEVVCFPELSLTGYSCQDLFFTQQLLTKADEALRGLLEFTRGRDVIAIVGMPVATGCQLLNCAVVVQKGEVLGVVAKSHLPNYNEFYEKRWFVSANEIKPATVSIAGHSVAVSGEPRLFVTAGGARFGIEICEDLWAPEPPSGTLALAGADIIFNLSASNELVGKHTYLMSLLAQQSARLICGYVYSGCGFGESTQDVVYGGNAMAYENGKLVAEGKRFSLEPQLLVAQIDVESLRTERRANTTFSTSTSAMAATVIQANATRPRPFAMLRSVEPWPFIPHGTAMEASCEEILSIQAHGLATRLAHTRCRCVVLGISGGLDSTLALLVCVRAFALLGLPSDGIVGVTMPGFGTTGRTHRNALALMQQLGVAQREISIAASVGQHFADIGHDPAKHDATYENSQARERTQILMDLANQLGGIVVGTGDLSELALGWATYNGDHMSMYGVNAGVPKTLIRHLVRHVAATMADGTIRATLLDIIATPISPELIPVSEADEMTQKTEDLVGPYELHDFFLYHFVRHGFRPAKIFMLAQCAFDGSRPGAGPYDAPTIRHWLTVFFRRFFSQQFKRSCMPDGSKVGSVSLSPRGDWRMPSDASVSVWLKECEELPIS